MCSRVSVFQMQDNFEKLLHTCTCLEMHNNSLSTIIKLVYKLLFQYLKAIIERTQNVINAVKPFHVRIEFGCTTDEGFVVEYGKCTCDFS